MRRVDIPAARRRVCARKRADEGRVANQKRIADRALRDVTRLPEAEGMKLAGAASAVTLRTILLRAAAPAGSQRLAADRDVAAETGAAEMLNDPNLHVAAVMARATVTRAATRPAEQEASTKRGGRP